MSREVPAEFNPDERSCGFLEPLVLDGYVVQMETLPGGRIRIISARKASASQRRKYEET